MNRILSLLVFLLCGVTQLTAQDTLLLLNGKSHPLKLYDMKDPDWVRYVTATGNGKVKKTDIYKVFAIKKADGTEQIIYQPDTAAGDPSISWVRDYIKGQQYGMLHKRQHFSKSDLTWHSKVNFTEVGGVAIGGAGSLLSFYGIPVPAIYAVAIGRSNAKLPPDPAIEPALKNSEGFLFGYQKQKRNQRIRQGFISGMIGFAVGIVAFTIIENQ
jgi:hypothetical protein